MKNEDILDQEFETEDFSFSIKITRIIFLIIVAIIIAIVRAEKRSRFL